MENTLLKPETRRDKSNSAYAAGVGIHRGCRARSDKADLYCSPVCILALNTAPYCKNAFRLGLSLAETDYTMVDCKGWLNRYRSALLEARSELSELIAKENPAGRPRPRHHHLSQRGG